MGSTRDEKIGRSIQMKCIEDFNIPTVIKVTSAHKAPEQTLDILSYYEGPLFD